jgi:hypothetical protein
VEVTRSRRRDYYISNDPPLRMCPSVRPAVTRQALDRQFPVQQYKKWRDLAQQIEQHANEASCEIESEQVFTESGQGSQPPLKLSCTCLKDAIYVK